MRIFLQVIENSCLFEFKLIVLSFHSVYVFYVWEIFSYIQGWCWEEYYTTIAELIHKWCLSISLLEDIFCFGKSTRDRNELVKEYFRMSLKTFVHVVCIDNLYFIWYKLFSNFISYSIYLYSHSDQQIFASGQFVLCRSLYTHLKIKTGIMKIKQM